MEPVKYRYSDSQFIGCIGGTLLLWSIRSRKVIKDYRKIMTDSISAIRTTADKKTLFLADRNCHQKEISLRNHNVTHDFGRERGYPIHSMAITPDDKYLFATRGPELEQYRIHDHELLGAYVLDHNIQSVATTNDNKHVFAGLEHGDINQICVVSQKVIKNYGSIHTKLTTMTVTRDNKFQIIGWEDQNLTKISIPDRQVVMDFGKNNLRFIESVHILPGDDSALVYDRDCYLKLIDLAHGDTIKDFGKAHRGWANCEYANSQSMLVTRDGEHLFTIASGNIPTTRFGEHKVKIASGLAQMKQWSVRGRRLVCDLGDLCQGIWCISD